MLVHQFLEDSARQRGRKVALICGDRRLTYREIDRDAELLAARLLDLGVRHGDRVVIFLDNSPEAVIALFATLKAGGVFVLLNATMKAPKLQYILRDSGARAIIALASRAEVVSTAAAAAPELEHLIWCRGTGMQLPKAAAPAGPPQSSILWESLLSADTSPPRAVMPRVIDIDLATIIYTSGSTGEPKGVVSAHYNVVAAARSITRYLRNQESDIVFNALPLSFDYGLYQVLMAFLFGGTVVLEGSFLYPLRALEKIVGEGVTGFPVVPTMVALLLQMENLARFDLRRLRYLTNTGAALPVSYIENLQRLLPHVEIFSMYGLTECKRVSYLPPEYLRSKPQSVGIPIPNEEVMIVGDGGEILGPGQVGELVVRGSNVMQGYWNCPEATARTFRPGRHRGEVLLYTGDLFRRDAEGFLYFVGRRDDMIKSKGERISPKEIENALCSLDGVAEAAVIGVPDDILGQAIKAYLVLRAGCSLSAAQVMRYCQRNLEPFMVPKYVEFPVSLPRNGSGKVDKKVLALAPGS